MCKGITTMRPLIEILEDERTLMHKLESIHRFILRDNDPDLLGVLYSKKEKIERNLGLVRIEIKEYMGDLFNKES